jgi:hypothetical protein
MAQSSGRGGFERLTRALALLVVVLGLAATSMGADVAQPPEPTRVLLVGNSYTQFHMLSRLIERLGASTDTPLHVDAVAHGGYTLRRHWLKSAARERIARGGYHLVVLQDHSWRPIDRPDELAEYGQRFARAAQHAGAATVLYQTWAPGPRAHIHRARAKSGRAPIDAEAMTARIGRAYEDLARREAARVAPVGRAFAHATKVHPEIDLHGSDGAHPSWAGSYLAACVLYGTLTGEDPRDATYAPHEVGREQAALLREVAASVLAPQPAE